MTTDAGSKKICILIPLPYHYFQAYLLPCIIRQQNFYKSAKIIFFSN